MEFIDNKVLDKNAIAKKSTYVSVVVNVILTILQFIIGIISGASSLVADAVHSFSDLLSDFLVLIARHFGQKAPDKKHPYGHQRYETAASFFLGLLLISVAVGMIYSAVLKIENYSSLSKVSSIALWMAGITLIAKELLFRYMLKEAQRIKSSLLIANAWHARSDAASSLVVAIGLIGNLAGFHFLDPVAALVVGLIIAKMGFQFGWHALDDLMDRMVDDETIQEITQTILETPGVKGFHDLKVRKMGDLLNVDIHLEIDGTISVHEGHAIALEARNRVLKNDQVLNVMTHVDPV